MKEIEYCNNVIELFASACERLNDYAQQLRRHPEYKIVKTGADIRSYQSGWRMEKWVELLLSERDGTWAAWWLQMGLVDKKWTIECHLSVSNGDLFIDAPTRRAISIEDFGCGLSEAVEWLVSALDVNETFAHEVRRRMAGVTCGGRRKP